MTTPKQRRPDVILVMKPVDGGRAIIGIIECPHCGETHYTTQIECGERDLFCGLAKWQTGECETIRPDGYSSVVVTRIV